MGRLGPELELARTKLKNVADGLTALCARCCRADGERSAKAKKLKWLYLQSDMTKMQTEAHSAMDILQGFVGLYNASLAIGFNLTLNQLNKRHEETALLLARFMTEGTLATIRPRKSAPSDRAAGPHLESAVSIVVEYLDNGLPLIELLVQHMCSHPTGFHLWLTLWNDLLRAKPLPRVIELSDDDVLSAGTAIHEAARTGVGMREALLREKRYIHHLDDCGQTPLHLAVARGHVDALDMLLEAKANTNLDNVQGETPLSLAITLGLSKVCSILVKAGCDIDKGANPWPKIHGLSSAMHFLVAQDPSYDEFIVEKAMLLLHYDASLKSIFSDPDGRSMERLIFNSVPLLRYLINEGGTLRSLPDGKPLILGGLALNGTSMACEFFETYESIPRENVFGGYGWWDAL
ncbi:Ankyrin repeat like protein [Verticillium longisporum]|uniref:Ankyrin repeat like protein n=1 Tax=Verticillium longisporum TaxID=100787 RepID=A0A8I3A4Q1_VERLO|nr:Ankyrin repeat like protein [Verticillium longisporum]